MASSYSADVASLLRTWTLEEMKYPGDWTDQVSELCSGPLSSVWQWVVSHCRSDSQVRTVLGNLALARRTATTSSGDMSLNVTRVALDRDLLSEKVRLMSELHSVVAKISRLKNVLEEQEKDRDKMEKNKEEAVGIVKQRRQRVVLLGLYIRQINQKLTKINELIKKFEEILQRRKFLEIKNEKTYCSDNGVESEHEKKVRESVELTVEHMKRVLNNAPEREGFGRRETRKQILSLTENLTPSVVMTCLLDQTHEMTRRVRRKVDEARKDCVSEEDHCPMVNSVIAEVEDFNAVHFAACLEVGNRKCSVARLMERFEVECLDVDPGIVDRLQRRAEAASLRESVRIAKSTVAEKEEQSERGQLFFELVAKQSKKVDELCDVISTLVARDHLLGTMSTQKNTSELLCNELTTKTEQAVSSVRNLTGVVALQSRTLTAASTTSLISAMVKGANSSTLTTTERLGIYKHRDTPRLSCVVARMESVARIRRELAELEDVGSGLQLEDRTSKLRTSLAESRRKQEAEVLPLLANTDVTRREGQDTAVKLGELHKDWVEQEAGDVAATTDLGWCEVEGRSLPRVLQDIRVLVAKYNKTIANL